MTDTSGGRRDLWRAVIQQAVEDATSASISSTSRLERDRARTWFERPSADFDEVCALAGYEPCQVRKETLAYIAEVDARGCDPTPAPSRKPKAPPKNAQRITYNGESLTFAEWAARAGLQTMVFRKRIKDGWTMEHALHGRPRPARPVRVPTTRPDRRATAKRITFAGMSLTMDQWARRLDISTPALRMRFRAGWPIERALTEVPNPEYHGLAPKLVEFDGEALTVKQWAQRLGLDDDTVRSRLKNPAWTIERALTTGKIGHGSDTPMPLAA